MPSSSQLNAFLDQHDAREARLGSSEIC